MKQPEIIKSIEEIADCLLDQVIDDIAEYRSAYKNKKGNLYKKTEFKLLCALVLKDIGKIIANNYYAE